MQTILVSYFSFVVYCNTYFRIRICWYRQSVACSFHPYMCGALSECAKAVYCELCIYFSSFALPRHFTLLPTLFNRSPFHLILLCTQSFYSAVAHSYFIYTFFDHVLSLPKTLSILFATTNHYSLKKLLCNI